ncbi:type IV toxin-antitoxin system AbiEi family antitoxin [Nocardioides daejeonensis]|uniref:type IV toxin-antitoxin system AbiEi family antitoxin n=1 Tax=Nocardioides daejeonensis TaxID=1046556 RepID=UPI000D74682A|nr:type IV toxin-antitoxin system AbiEi family antitoxin [Nocardioides daejeonensis]
MRTPPSEPFWRSDALSCGITDHDIKAWVVSGQIRRVFRGVYAPSRLSDSLELRVACARLVLPEHCVVVERSAAWLYGIDLHSPDERFVVPELEVVALRGHNRLRRSGVYGATRDLEPEDLTCVGDVPVTTPLRTAMDLACLRGVPPALTALDRFMRTYGVTHDQWAAQLPRYRRRRGVVQLRRLIPLASPLAESPGESWTRALLIEAGFPPPTLQIEFTRHGRLVAKADMGYPHLRIAIEYFGEEFHGPREESDDRARIAWLESQGWHVIVVRKEDLRGPALEAWLAELAQVVAERTLPRGKRAFPRGQAFIR